MLRPALDRCGRVNMVDHRNTEQKGYSAVTLRLRSGSTELPFAHCPLAQRRIFPQVGGRDLQRQPLVCLPRR